MMTKDFLSRDLLEGTSIPNCECGKNHSVSIKRICFSKDIESDFLPILKTYIIENKKGLMVCDLNTYEVLGEKIENICKTNGIGFSICKYPTKEILIPDEDALGTLLLSMGSHIQCILGVGSGTINDLARFMASKFNLPFISVPTAPSVDGFSSSVAALIIEGQKVTLPAKEPEIIVVDIPTLVKSPLKMQAAGLGDLLGKIICQMDWRLSMLFNDDPFCEHIADLMQQALNATVSAFKATESYNEEMIESLIRGLILSGLAISMFGNSRPASNSEHHISHFFELMALGGKATHFLHGETVAFGLLLSEKLYQAVFGQSFEEFLQKYELYHEKESKSSRIQRLERAYTPLHEKYLESYKKSKVEDVKKKKLLSELEKKWTIIQEWIEKFIGPEGELETFMDSTSIPIHLSDFKFSKEMALDALLCAKEIRDRYTILTLLDQIGILEYYSGVVVDQLE
jgi:glycerol-1-phosphate dehydrogenase [NAD(P)+]